MSTKRKPKLPSSELTSRRQVIRQLVALPAAFTILPLALEGRSAPHDHVVGMAAAHPCPGNWTFIGEMVVNGVRMCVYRDPEGVMHAVACGTSTPASTAA